ncbi:hypothetical protein B0J11DRAFT_598407 [Dendryphion nanum]|uniref:Rhodopsin domain-containing protein n=1 Tax=Dendryphion nanum TaxID=256645 RepID=A0A9P9D322_9PLEO|nr:hypothetical protein B0J11DRAFT_598407 [Dendryphion nanum]
MANVAPLGPDDSIATQLLIPCGILQVIVVVLYVARMYARLHPVPKLWLDDYTISLATAISITGYALQIAACKHGLGRHNAYVTSREQAAALHYLFGLYSIWVVGVGLVRVSIACTLLRVWDVKAWRWTLWALIIVQMISVTSTFIVQFTECHPLRAMWDVVPGAKCWTPAQMHTFGYVFAITNIALDFVLSLMPIAFLRRLRRPLAERIVIAFLMALGLVATAAAIIKTSYMRDFAITGDTLRDIVHINMWCKIEEQLGIVAYSTNGSHVLSSIDRQCGHVDTGEGAKRG